MLYLYAICWMLDVLSPQALVKWCNSEGEDAAACEQSYQRMLTQVTQLGPSSSLVLVSCDNFLE